MLGNQSGLEKWSHDFTIRGYSLAKGMGVGRYIASDTFKAGGYDWVIRFYPDGKNLEDDSVCVSVFIALVSDDSDVKALFKLTLLDQSGKGKHKVHSHRVPYTLKCPGSMWGYERFLTRVSLETSDYLKDDGLSMHCTVGVVRNRVEGSQDFTIAIAPYDMGQSLKYLLETETGCDVVLRVGNQTFKAHKSILAARSPVFRALFFGNHSNMMGDQVELKDVEPSVFKAMLLFIYSDALPDSLSTNIIQHVFAAADRFGLDRLKQLCEAKLHEEVTVDTVATVLSFADQHGCSQLKLICQKFVCENTRGVMKKEGSKYVLGIIQSLAVAYGPIDHIKLHFLISQGHG